VGHVLLALLAEGALLLGEVDLSDCQTIVK
jgi:hypothetical protein